MKTTAANNNVTEMTTVVIDPQPGIGAAGFVSSEVSVVLLILLTVGAALFGLFCGMMLVWCCQRKRISKYDSTNGKVKASVSIRVVISYV